MNNTPAYLKLATTVILSEVVVRPIGHEERVRWDALMRQHHYLGFNRTAGRALRQIAEYQGQWLALLLWQALPFTHKYLYPDPTAPSSNPAHNICR